MSSFILPRARTATDPPTLDYGTPTPTRPRFRAVALVLANYAVGIFFLGLFFILSLSVHGRWYVGHAPRWVVSIDATAPFTGIVVGPVARPLQVGTVPTILLRALLFAALPAAIYRSVSRRLRRSRAG